MTRPTSRAEEGGALPAVMTLIVLLSILTLTLLTYDALRVRFVLREGDRLQAQLAAEAALYEAEVAMQRGEIGPGEPVSLALGASSRIRAEAAFIPWGGYALVLGTGYAGRQRHSQLAVLGGPSPDWLRYALLLASPEDGITLADTARLIGPVRTGQAGLRTATVSQRVYRGQQEGAVEADFGVALPDIPASLLRMTLGEAPIWLSQERAPHPYWRVAREYPVAGDSSTSRPVMLLPPQGLVEGLGALPAFSAILCPERCLLRGPLTAHHLLVYAPEGIRLEGPVSGSMHLASEGPVVLSGDIVLAYPSSAVTTGRLMDADTQEALVLEGQVYLDGTLALTSEPLREGASRRLVIGPEARVRGLVFSSESAEIGGTVHGTVAARALQTYLSPAIYINWLIGGVIDRSLRPDAFVPASLW